MIQLKNISFHYNGKEPILENLSLKLEPGKLFGLVGPNGSGKTTLSKILMGIYTPKSGHILADLPYKPDLTNENWKASLGVLSGAGTKLFHTLDIDEQVTIYSSLYNRFSKPRFYDLMANFGYNGGFLKKVSALSFGERIKVELALTLAYQPKIIILDEPTVGLDPIAIGIVRKALISYVQEHQALGLLTSHNLRDIVEVCEIGGFLKDKSIQHTFICAEENEFELEEKYKAFYV